MSNTVKNYTIPEEDRVGAYMGYFAKTAQPEVKEYRGPYKSRRKFDNFIEITFDYEGFHKYENAPDEVAFLRHTHRHMFTVNCTIEVFHDDRELEFFIVLNDIKTQVLPFMHSGNLGSCEQQAEYIANGILNLYGEHRYVLVTVYEDNENGGTATWQPKGDE